MSPDEMREASREASIEVKDIRYFGSQTWPFPSNIMIGFRAEYASPRHGSIARAMLDAWVAESRKEGSADNENRKVSDL